MIYTALQLFVVELLKFIISEFPNIITICLDIWHWLELNGKELVLVNINKSLALPCLAGEHTTYRWSKVIKGHYYLFPQAL